ncbi:MAG: CRISPR-associated endonuclease Cas1 [Planctomycetaceae bacterium]
MIVSAHTNPFDVPELIPARMLNEFAYCPRLGYLEFVHGEWDDNLETRQGTFGHRRVDKPDRRSIPAPHLTTGQNHEAQASTDVPAAAPSLEDTAAETADQSTIHARSLMLSAPDEGLIAKLDLLELDGQLATPVDYKRGKAPKGEQQAWEPERVQLCAQGLILRANGYQCVEGVLYYIASKKRVVIPFDDELIARTRSLLAEFRQTSAEGIVPPPLVDSPKCPRCSLVGICLPDETVFLQSDPEAAAEFEVSASEPDAQTSDAAVRDRPAPPVRKLLPARDDALPLYIQEQGAMLGKSGDRLQIKLKGDVQGERRLMDVSQVSLFGSVMMSAQALSELTGRGIPICHFSYGGWFHGITTGLVHKNVELRICQYRTAANSETSLMIARQLISGKIRNCRTLLRRHLSKDADGVKLLLDQLDRYRQQAEQTTSAESLLGIEGMAAKVYFSGLFQLIGQRHAFDVNDRNRRPPRDPVNAVLSFAYALLTKELTITLQAVGFDPMLGVFHRPRYGRPSLALDLAEEYRPLIADSVMLTAFNNGELSADQFLQRAGSVTLTPAGRTALIRCFERRMQTEVSHPIFGYKLSYRRLLEVQSRLLARTMLGELNHYPAFCTR